MQKSRSLTYDPSSEPLHTPLVVRVQGFGLRVVMFLVWCSIARRDTAGCGSTGYQGLVFRILAVGL